ncbi:AAA family ATPase [Frankia sp. AgB1.9]|uniref:AAA family ATPase n=1 Tax=unclassified Frankia TaxID=2632575 RepID=UPI001933C459|nr:MULTISPECIES: AAA family ATPase [unclassified Frankia]MBL7492471.1 AAA family ATPase [Frankia sp. AgW1.1]MBL7547071.1 AAA family ATPase [Frankia sp. AgB1.9]MBL7619362.1 AAA family ATPase [Frankia sp. AgB1.8]
MVWFVGRGSELDRLSAQYAAAVVSGLRCVLVEGQAGIGKTTLLDQFLARLPTGSDGSDGAADPGGHGGPGGPAGSGGPAATVPPVIARVEAADSVRSHDLDLANRLLTVLTAVAERPAPGLSIDPAAATTAPRPTHEATATPRSDAPPGSDAPPDPDAEPEAGANTEADADIAAAERIRQTGELLLGAAARRCADGPLVIRIDDVHWCDAPSLRAIQYLLLHGARLPLLLVVAGRRHDSPWLDGVRRRAQVAGAVLDLAGFGEAELAELCAATGRPPLPPRRSRSLVEATSGNPLWITKWLAAHGDSDAVPTGDGSVPAVGQAVVGALRAPESLGSLVTRDLASCPPAGRRLAAAVAVLGRTARLTDLAAIAGIADPAGALAEAVRHDLVDTVGQPPALRVSPPHALVRAVIYHAIDLPRRSALHLAVAEAATDRATALEHRAAAALTPDGGLADELIKLAATEATTGRYVRAADHLLLAAPLTPDPAQAHALRLDAAMSFLQAGERAEAAAILAQDDRDGAEADGDRRADSSPRRRYVRAHLDLLANRAEQGVLGFMASWEAARAAGDAETAAQSAAWLAQAFIPAGFYDEAGLWAARAFDERCAPSPLRAQGLALLAASRTASTGDGGRALAELAAGAEALDPTPHTSAALRIGRGVVRLWSGDLPGAAADLDPVTYAPDTAMHLRLLAMTHFAEATFRAGRWRQALACGQDAVALAESAGHIWVLPFVYANAALVPAARGDAAAAGRLLARAAELDGDGVPAMWAYHATATAHLAAALDDPAGVVEACARVVTLANPAGALAPGVFEWRHLFVEALVRLRRFDEAAGELVRLEDEAGRRGSAVTLAVAARARGLLAAGQRRLDEAVALFEQSAREAAALSMPFDAAQATLRAGEIHRRQRRTRRAADALTDALGAFETLGATTYARRCRELLAVVTGPAANTTRRSASPPPQPSALPTAGWEPVTAGRTGEVGPGQRALTDRERALLVRILRGDDFEAIARELYLSRGHAENLARDLYRMHGVSSRAELAGLYLGLRDPSGAALVLPDPGATGSGQPAPGQQ